MSTLVTTLALVEAAIAALWLLAVVASRLWYRRLIGLPLLRNRSMSLVPYAPDLMARAAARQRIRAAGRAVCRHSGWAAWYTT